MTCVFLDANVYFAGCASSTGASALILRLVLKGRIGVTASRLVLREAERNLRRKRPSKDLQAFHRFLKQAKPRVIPTPPEAVWAKYEGVIHPKDVPVLAAAVAAKVEYLITLDPSTRAPASLDPARDKLAGGPSLGMSPVTRRGVVLPRTECRARHEVSESRAAGRVEGRRSGAPGLPGGLHRRHFLTKTVSAAVRELTILTPGDFLRTLVQQSSLA